MQLRDRMGMTASTFVDLGHSTHDQVQSYLNFSHVWPSLLVDWRTCSQKRPNGSMA